MSERPMADERHCEGCGQVLTGRRPQTRTCSDRCRQTASRARLATPPTVTDGARVVQHTPETVTTPVAADDRTAIRWPELVVATLRADPALADLAGVWQGIGP